VTTTWAQPDEKTYDAIRAAWPEACLDDKKLADNYYYHGLYGLESGFYSAAKKPANLWWYEKKKLCRAKTRLSRREWIERFFFILRKDGRIGPLVMNPAQRRFYAMIVRIERKKLPVRIVILKARQIGFSTLIQAICFHESTRGTNLKSIIIANVDETAELLLSIANTALTEMPKTEEKPWEFKMTSKSAYSLVWAKPIGSSIKITSAKRPAPGRGGMRRFAHKCLAPDTRVLVEHGRVVRVSELQAGAKVLTHTGAHATVTAVTASAPIEANGAGRTVKIRAWLGGETELTPNHPVFTRRGWVPAGELHIGDEVSMPVRKITHEISGLVLPTMFPPRENGSGVNPHASGAEFPLNEETGFAVGYYLAEGSFGSNPNGASCINFHRHKSEKRYADRAIAALDGLYKSRRLDVVPTSQGETDVIYGTPLARFFEAEFGRTDEKRIPDWVFHAGEPFARGVLAGYLSGDGSKTVTRQGGCEMAIVCATSIRASLATQARDIAASLGYGWAAMDYKPAGLRAGREELQAWTARWSGKAARALRALMDLPPVKGGHSYSEKAVVADGFVWTKIRKLEEGRVSEVYDVEVDHDDHSFRTLHFSVKNSETAFWENAQEKATGLINSIPNVPGTHIFNESTANGQGGFFHDEFWDSWNQREVPLEKRTRIWEAMFFAWFEDPGYRLSKTSFAAHGFSAERAAEIARTLDDEERWLLQQTYHERGVGFRKVDLDQLAWRRMTIQGAECRGDINLFNQEYPSRPEVAFLASGRPVFDTERLQTLWLQAKEPIWRGDLVQA
jgi:hypothetical protein